MSHPLAHRCMLFALIALLAFVAITPPHGEGPSFCLCAWGELLGCDADSHPEGEGEDCHECHSVPIRLVDAPSWDLSLAWLSTWDASSASVHHGVNLDCVEAACRALESGPPPDPAQRAGALPRIV